MSGEDMIDVILGLALTAFGFFCLYRACISNGDVLYVFSAAASLFAALAFLGSYALSSDPH